MSKKPSKKKRLRRDPCNQKRGKRIAWAVQERKMGRDVPSDVMSHVISDK